MGRISIIGFGKIGQAIAANILRQNINVTAIDTNPGLHIAFEKGEYKTKEPGIWNSLTHAYENNKLAITTNFAFAKESDAIIIAISLLIDQNKKIQYGPFLEAIKNLIPFLVEKTLIVIETSVPVGFARDIILPFIEKEGKVHGKDFLLAHSPERIKSGSMLKQLGQIPKVIGGISEEATGKAYEIYQWFFDQKLLYKVETIEAAEMLKMAGMIYRDVNIALSNQLAQYANKKEIDYAVLIPLINTDKEANLLQPGIGVGGHCTPVYPYFLIDNFQQAGFDFTLAKQSRVINDNMAGYSISLVSDLVKNKKALILGLSFRPNVKEDALSTTYLLNEELLKAGFEVWVNDIEFDEEEIKERNLQPCINIYDSNCEVAFLVTLHKEYSLIDFEKLASSGIKFFLDGRNSIPRDKVEKAGIIYLGIGH